MQLERAVIVVGGVTGGAGGVVFGEAGMLGGIIAGVGLAALVVESYERKRADATAGPTGHE